jgi:hypothetical protein
LKNYIHTIISWVDNLSFQLGMTDLTQEDKDKLLAQIDREYQEGFDYVVNKRNQYRDRVIRWNKQAKDPNKININMIANAIDTLIASSYTD